MADNPVVNGVTVAGDDVGSAIHQYVKVEYGADNSATPVSGTNPLPVGWGVLAGKGRKTVTTAGTDVALSASSVPCRLVSVQALDTNTMPVTIGTTGVDGAGATRDGIAMYPNDPPMWVWTTNLNAVFVDSLVNGEGVSFIYFN